MAAGQGRRANITSEKARKIYWSMRGSTRVAKRERICVVSGPGTGPILRHAATALAPAWPEFREINSF